METFAKIVETTGTLKIVFFSLGKVDISYNKLLTALTELYLLKCPVFNQCFCFPFFCSEVLALSVKSVLIFLTPLDSCESVNSENKKDQR